MFGNTEFQDNDAFKNDEEQEFGQAIPSQNIENNQQKILIEEANNTDNQLNLYREILDNAQNENMVLKQVSSKEIN